MTIESNTYIYIYIHTFLSNTCKLLTCINKSFWNLLSIRFRRLSQLLLSLDTWNDRRYSSKTTWHKTKNYVMYSAWIMKRSIVKRSKILKQTSIRKRFKNINGIVTVKNNFKNTKSWCTIILLKILNMTIRKLSIRIKKCHTVVGIGTTQNINKVYSIRVYNTMCR